LRSIVASYSFDVQKEYESIKNYFIKQKKKYKQEHEEKLSVLENDDLLPNDVTKTCPKSILADKKGRIKKLGGIKNGQGRPRENPKGYWFPNQLVTQEELDNGPYIGKNGTVPGKEFWNTLKSFSKFQRSVMEYWEQDFGRFIWDFIG